MSFGIPKELLLDFLTVLELMEGCIDESSLEADELKTMGKYEYLRKKLFTALNEHNIDSFEEQSDSELRELKKINIGLTGQISSLESKIRQLEYELKVRNEKTTISSR